MKVLVVLSFLALAGISQGDVIHYAATLSGPAESPANASPGTGIANVLYDDVAHTMRVVVSFTGLTAGVTASHIHAPTAAAGTGTAGVATTTPTFTGFPSGVTFGTYDHTFDMTLASSYNSSFVTNNGGTTAGAEAALFAAMAAGKTYLNIHTTNFPGGEIRGFLHNVPDAASTASLLGLALAAMLGFARNRKIA
jgi:hypothetical protein